MLISGGIRRFFFILGSTAVMFTGLLFFTVQDSKATTFDYSKEIQADQFRPHGGDKSELNQFFKKLADNLGKVNETKEMIASNSATKAKVLEYISGLSDFEKLDIIYSRIEKLYTVTKADAYTNYRSLVRFKFIGHQKDGKLIERVDYLALAKLGKEPGDWKLWGVIWQDTGIDVADASLAQLDMPAKGEEICIMTTDAGVIKMRLFPNKAPKAVKNFKALALKDFYNGMPFLRVYNDFMIQGGSMDGTKEYDYSSFGGLFETEFSPDLFNFRGALCMGNVGPNTNSNQFYIVQSSKVDPLYLELSSLPLNVEAKYKEIGGRAYLDMRYTVFGQVFQGIEAVDTIARQKADDDGKPIKTPMKVLKVEFVKY